MVSIEGCVSGAFRVASHPMVAPKMNKHHRTSPRPGYVTNCQQYSLVPKVPYLTSQHRPAIIGMADKLLRDLIGQFPDRFGNITITIR
ncbi:MAG: hypothetical protein ACXVIZ_09270 [Halobacteriota archaeon]